MNRRKQLAREPVHHFNVYLYGQDGPTRVVHRVTTIRSLAIEFGHRPVKVERTDPLDVTSQYLRTANCLDALEADA